MREAMLRAPGDDGTGPAMQLLAPLSPDTTIAKFIDRRGPGLQQVAYRVTDVEAAADALRAKGLRVLYEKAVAARRTARRTSCTRRTPAACSSSWWNQPPTPEPASPRFRPGESPVGCAFRAPGDEVDLAVDGLASPTRPRRLAVAGHRVPVAHREREQPGRPCRRRPAGRPPVLAATITARTWSTTVLKRACSASCTDGCVSASRHSRCDSSIDARFRASSSATSLRSDAATSPGTTTRPARCARRAAARPAPSAGPACAGSSSAPGPSAPRRARRSARSGWRRSRTRRTAPRPHQDALPRGRVVVLPVCDHRLPMPCDSPQTRGPQRNPGGHAVAARAAKSCQCWPATPDRCAAWRPAARPRRRSRSARR